MKVYKIKHDHSKYKFYLQDDKDPLAVKAFSNYGVKLSNDWVPFNVFLFEGKTKKEKELREDINSSCFDDGLLYVSEDVAFNVFNELNEVEILPIHTNNKIDFKYINVINVLPSLKYHSKDELKEMYQTGKYIFDKEVIEQQYIFRDKILSSTYFVTEKFISKFGKKFKGVVFIEVGEV
ncbi:hypothetical protein [Erwinia sp. CGal63]|uniref:hypothetical protein n=1 Tax=Erwinia sp. CGal63 TaxID=2919889 RepID=UPI00300A1833